MGIGKGDDDSQASAFQHKGGFMVAFLIVALFVGTVLGLRFNVFVLVPAILLAIAVIALRDIATRQSVGVILVTTFATVVLLQIGYIAGRVVKVATQTYSADLGAHAPSALQIGAAKIKIPNNQLTI